MSGTTWSGSTTINGFVPVTGPITNTGDVTFDAGGTLDLVSGNFTNQGTFVGAGGTFLGESGTDLINNGQILSGTALTIDAAVTGTGTLALAGGATLTLGSTVAATDTINFTGASDDLVLANGNNVLAPINNFANSGEIDLASLAYSETSLSYSPNSGQLTVDEGSAAQTIVVTDLTFQDFANLTVVSDGHGGTLVESLCFLAGTAIATPSGDRAIETLAAGDLVLTADGEARPVRWLGRQTVASRFADPMRSAPIRIVAGALGENLPLRDLLVSPDHALMVDGVFVQAGALVNGLSITRETDLPESFVYYHVELADHSLVLAEGVPAETFIDNVDRLAFDNWDEHDAAAADAPLIEMAQPRAKAHRQVPRTLRERLLARGLTIAGSAAASAA